MASSFFVFIKDSFGLFLVHRSLLRILKAVAAHKGTCPFPMALSLSTLEATPLTIPPTLRSIVRGVDSGSLCHQFLSIPQKLNPMSPSIWRLVAAFRNPI